MHDEAVLGFHCDLISLVPSAIQFTCINREETKTRMFPWHYPPRLGFLRESFRIGKYDASLKSVWNFFCSRTLYVLYIYWTDELDI